MLNITIPPPLNSRCLVGCTRQGLLEALRCTVPSPMQLAHASTHDPVHFPNAVRIAVQSELTILLSHAFALETNHASASGQSPTDTYHTWHCERAAHCGTSTSSTALRIRLAVQQHVPTNRCRCRDLYCHSNWCAHNAFGAGGGRHIGTQSWDKLSTV
jgi:hypothetical protein